MPLSSASDINQRYRTLRPRLLMCIFIGYAAFYLARKSVNYVQPELQTDLGLERGILVCRDRLFTCPAASLSLLPA